MISPKGLDPNDVVRYLQSGYRNTAVCEETLEETRDTLRRLFAAVSDAVFLYQAGEIVLQNENGRHLMGSFGSREPILATELYRNAGQVLRGLPVTLTLADDERRRVLVIHSAKALRLEEGNAMLVTVVDLSAAFEQTATLEKASAEERRRIARDLHDGLSQMLASLQFQAKALATQKSGNPHANAHARIAALAMVCARKARELHHEFYEI